MRQVFDCTSFYLRFVLEEDAWIAWHTLEENLLEISYDAILERQIRALELRAEHSQPGSMR